jgi:hypothetical protein
VEVPLDVEVDEPPLPLEVQHVAGRVNYNALVRVGGYIRFSFDPERAGHSRLFVGIYDMIEDERPVQYIVATHASGRESARALVLTRVSAGRFVGDVNLAVGSNTFVVLARSADDIRARAKMEIDIPRH